MTGWLVLGRILVLLAVVMLVLVAVPVESGSRVLEGTLSIDWAPDPLRLLEGATGTVRMDVRNLANVTMRVGFVYMVVKSPGASGGNITPDLIELQPGDTQRVDVSIQSYGGSLHPDVSDGHLQVYWGPNLTRNETTWPHFKGWVGSEEIVLPVSTVSNSLLFVVALVIVVVAVVASIAYMERRKERSQSGPDPAPPRGR